MKAAVFLTPLTALAVALTLAACGSGSSSTDTAPGTPTTVSVSLPLGDGKTSATPKTGYLMSCVTQFQKTAVHGGPWIQGSVWYPGEKIAVQGAVGWPSGRTSVAPAASGWLLSSNNLPDPPQTTGVFPIQTTDPAYQYDTNPNAIQAQTIRLSLPPPAVASAPTCVPMGMIGFTVDGVAIFDALDNAGHDAVAHEVQDSCNGHPDKGGQYHYHGPSPCMPNETTSGLVGYALDGFGIYGEKDPATAKTLHDADLDACHGTTSEVQWHGQPTNIYHYVLTEEFPYTVGCFKGTPVAADLTAAQKSQINNFP